MTDRAQLDRRRIAIPASPTTSVQTLHDLVARRADTMPERPALLVPGSPTLDYRGLAERIRRVSDALAGLGIGRDDVVAVSLSNGPDLAVAILGAACAATAAPIAPTATSFETERLLDEMEVKAAVVAAGSRLALRRTAMERGVPTLELETGKRAGEVRIEAPSARRTRRPHASDVALLLLTSGTTSRPKQVPLTHRDLVGAADRVVDSLRLQADDRCLDVMPLIHAHGLLGGLLPSLRAGGSVLCTTSFDPREVLAQGREVGVTWTTAAPAVYRSWLGSGEPAPRFRFLRSASAPMPPDLAVALEERFEAPLIEVYGMTEAYQVAANPLPPGERRFGTVGQATGTEIAVVDEAGSILDAGQEGEIVLRGPAIFQGYRASREENERAFVRGWFRTGDAGALDRDGYLRITGRLREVINRGGEKIAPREIEETLTRHPDVREVVCFPLRDVALGEEIGALVVPAAGADPDPREMRRFAASRLAPTKVPRRFWFRDHVPVDECGKLNRLGLAERLGLDPGSSRHDALPPDAPKPVAGIKEELRALWTELLALEVPPTDDDPFFDLGGTSLGLVELLVEVERRFGVRLQIGAILEAPSVAEMAERIETSAAAASATGGRIEVQREAFTASVVPIRPIGTRPPLFLVSPAGGSVLPFYRLAHALGPEQPLFGLEVALPRRAARVRIEVSDLAAAFLEGMRRLRFQGPWRLGGWSFGGFVAWELACRLRDDGETVSHVVLVDSDATALGRRPTIRGVAQGLGRLTQMIRYAKPFLRDGLHVRLAAALRGTRNIGPLRRVFMSLLWKAGIERADIARHIERDPRLLEVRTATWGILRNMVPFIRASRSYSPEPRQEDLDLIRAGQVERDTAGGRGKIDALGWERYASGKIHVHPMAGNHFTVLHPAHVDELAEIFERILAREADRLVSAGSKY